MIGFISSASALRRSDMLILKTIETKKKMLIFRHYDSAGSELISLSNGMKVKAEQIKHPLALMSEIQGKNPATHIIVIDDVHLFHQDLVDVVIELSYAGFDVLCAGRVLDWTSTPSQTCTELMAFADQVIKVFADCHFCKSKQATKNIEIDEEDSSEYFPACNSCYKRILEQFDVDYVGRFPRYLASIPNLSANNG